MTDEEILAQRATIYMSTPIIERDGKRFIQIELFGRLRDIPLPSEPDEPPHVRPSEEVEDQLPDE